MYAMTPADTARIDWNEVWRKSHAAKRIETRDPAFWNKRAPEFVRPEPWPCPFRPPSGA